nr:HyaD/HybD family hydrogenase maturation endopeptidase [Desulfobulbaceae bacterium]
MSALVLGVGNVLLGDEGIGIRVVEELQHNYAFADDVEILDGGTAGIELLRYIENRNLLIIVDAMAAERPPGTVFKVEGEDVPKRFMTKISPHQIGLSDLLAAGILSESIPKNIVLFGVEPEKLETGIYLSNSVTQSIDKIVSAILDELISAGYQAPSPKTSTVKSQFWP